jgi:tetratricopeptide (TPR) repeat protein
MTRIFVRGKCIKIPLTLNWLAGFDIVEYMKRPGIIITLLMVLASSLSAQDRRLALRHFDSGERAYLGGRYDEALEEYDRGLAIDPGYYDAYPARAQVREQLSDWNGAVTDYNIYLEAFPDNAEVRFGRGLARYQAEQYTFAAEDFRHLLKVPASGETKFIFYRQSLEGGGTDRIITAQGGIRDYLYNYLGLAESKLGHYDSALACFDSAIRLNPREPDYYVHRGLTRQEAGDLQGARSDYQQALRLNPQHAIAYHNLSTLIKATGGADSEAMLDRAIENNPSLPYSWMERGYYRLERSDYKGALHDYNQAVRLAPEDAESWLNRGIAKEKLKDYTGAYDDFTRAVSLTPQLEKAWLCRGNVLTKMQRFEEAVEDYTVAILYYPEYGIAWFNRAIANHRLGRKDAACADVQKAASLGVTGTGKLKAATCR